MSLLRALFRGYLIRRLLGGGGRRRRRYDWLGRPRGRSGYGYGMGHRGPGGLYRPRHRGNVRVTGCCLPIPLAFVTGLGLGTRALVGRRRG